MEWTLSIITCPLTCLGCGQQKATLELARQKRLRVIAVVINRCDRSPPVCKPQWRLRLDSNEFEQIQSPASHLRQRVDFLDERIARALQVERKRNDDWWYGDLFCICTKEWPVHKDIVWHRTMNRGWTTHRNSFPSDQSCLRHTFQWKAHQTQCCSRHRIEECTMSTTRCHHS